MTWARSTTRLVTVMEGTARRLLLVDDDEGFCDALALTLSDAGYHASSATTTEAASRLLGAHDFDLVVMDIHMPGNARLEWARGLATSHPRLPVILVTGQPALETAVDAISLRVVAYLIKPVTGAQLLAEVARLLAEADARTDAAVAERVAQLTQRLGLTSRQAEVLRALVAGQPNKQIATELGCTVRTVEDHVGSLLRRSGVASRAALVAQFWQR